MQHSVLSLVWDLPARFADLFASIKDGVGPLKLASCFWPASQSFSPQTHPHLRHSHSAPSPCSSVYSLVCLGIFGMAFMIVEEDPAPMASEPTAVVVATVASPPPEIDGAATALYRHECANKGNYGEECPDRWSKFASHEDEAASLKAEIQNDPIIHRYTFSKDDKKCERRSCLIY